VDLRFHLGAAPEDVRMAPKVESTWRGLLSQPGLILLVGPEGAGFGTTVSAGPSTARVRLRRAEDVERAVRAAEGGQTVLARIVAPGLAQGLARFREMAPSRAAAAVVLRGALHQVRLRRVCRTCVWPGDVDNSAGERFGVVPFAAPVAGVGCPNCGFRRYHGSFYAFELAVTDDRLRDALDAGAPLSEIGERIGPVAERTIQVDAVAQAIAGFTTVEELVRVVPVRPTWASRSEDRHRGLFRAVTPLPDAIETEADESEPELPVVMLIVPPDAAAVTLRAAVRGRADVVSFRSAAAALACTHPVRPSIGILAQWAQGGWQQELIQEWRSLGARVVLLGPAGDLAQMEAAFALGADDYAGSLEELGVRLTRWLQAPPARRATG
jgi:hypothetical protein